MEQKSLQVSIDSENLEILKSYESLFKDVMEKKFKCTSNLESPMDSAKVFKMMLSSQIELSVWKDDLTRHTADAVVNAANEQLAHIGGLALALVRAGGPLIEKESRDIIMRQWKVPTSEIAITTGGLLPCSCIIHAVGPQWSERKAQQCCQELERAIANILHYVTNDSRGIKTVAIPALSSGIFGFPLDLCVEIIINTIVRFPFLQSNKVLKEIHLVSNEEPTVAAFKRYCENLPYQNLSILPPFISIAFNNINLQIIEGFIEKQQVDVIVNSVSATNSFEMGNVSNAILSHAGTEIEKEFFKTYEMSKGSKLVVVTKGFNLACKYVYHVVWPSNHHTKKTLREAVKRCLEKSCQENMNSISFPALGTGNIGLPKEEAIPIMLKEIFQFSKNHPQKKLLVNFVVYPNDYELYQVIKSELDKMMTQQMGQMATSINKKNKKSVPHISREWQKEADLEKARSPSIHLKGNKEEHLDAAKKWVHKLLQAQECRVIENNHIFYFGKEEHDLLTHLKNKFEVSIREDIRPGKATLEITGRLKNIIPMMLNIEILLWRVQMDWFDKILKWLISLNYSSSIKPQEGNVHMSDFLKEEMLQKKKKVFEKAGLEVQKVKSISNLILEATYKDRKKMIQSRRGNGNVSLTLYQEVPYQFCKLIKRIGFQSIYSMPPDAHYGDGIYFNKSLGNLVDNIRRTPDSDCLIYIFEAEVAVGAYCRGNAAYISPPPLGTRTMDAYDSVVDDVNNPETFVIFDSTQALPQFLYTCVLKKSNSSQIDTQNKSSKGSSV
ncbi:protein mono-ADP-ribosyltransferase PARP9 [Gracilinanus agilis]|uniref:protein mono-ADP-ribosyltransferase PARP9 n=1 Tax=Gracilinanus agilis TaxID=191870 RepID=UPI001CFDCB37|nr:protein mono-ADP-ribosyltransferase PARP9 [Gracilinanus agilis]